MVKIWGKSTGERSNRESRTLVEAPGVEPGSEKARREKPTCVSDSVVVGCPVRTEEEEDSLARLISAFGYEQKPTAQPAKMTFHR